MITHFLIKPARHPEFTLTGEVPAKGDMLHLKTRRKPEELGTFTVETYQVTAVHREYGHNLGELTYQAVPSELRVTVHVNHVGSALE